MIYDTVTTVQLYKFMELGAPEDTNRLPTILRIVPCSVMYLEGSHPPFYWNTETVTFRLPGLLILSAKKCLAIAYIKCYEFVPALRETEYNKRE